MTIIFKPINTSHLPLWDRWIIQPHVKSTWFLDGYESAENIHEIIKGNGYDYGFIIELDNKPIGYIQTSDLFAYKIQCPNPTGLFLDEPKGTFCIDLFIGETDYLNKGYGTQIIKLFCEKLKTEFKANKIVIDPAESNKRAIRCYEKAGFKLIKTVNDGVVDCMVMELLP